MMLPRNDIRPHGARWPRWGRPRGPVASAKATGRRRPAAARQRWEPESRAPDRSRTGWRAAGPIQIEQHRVKNADRSAHGGHYETPDHADQRCQNRKAGFMRTDKGAQPLRGLEIAGGRDHRAASGIAAANRARATGFSGRRCDRPPAVPRKSDPTRRFCEGIRSALCPSQPCHAACSMWRQVASQPYVGVRSVT